MWNFQASNPAQFEQPDNEATWQRNGQVLSYNGPIAVGTEKQIDNAQLSVMGNIVSTGTHTRPSDRRVKENIVDVRSLKRKTQKTINFSVEYQRSYQQIGSSQSRRICLQARDRQSMGIG